MLTSISVWHPLFGPIEDYPLAVCDSRTVGESDLVESDFIYPDFESETFCVSFSPSQKWYYMKDQGRQDVLVLSNFDSETGLRVPHSGFALPGDGNLTRERESFEMKVIAVS